MSESPDPAPQLLLRNLEVEDLSTLMPQYEFDSLIAEGGMGKVFRAIQKSLDRPVAIKLLKSEFGRDPAFRESFQREAQSMAKLNHPNLVAVYDFGQIQGLLFIVMEFVEGQTLHDACHGHPLVAEEAAQIIAGTCRGLAHAHEAGIIHRDIKPANILIDADLQPKLVDFGVAEAADTVHSSNEQIFGTPDYAAPEMCESPPRVSEKSDIFAVGVLFYELLTGSLPTAPYTPPSRVTQTPVKYDPLVAKAMHPSPEQRFANTTEFAEVIEKCLTNTHSPLLQPQAGATSPGPALRALAPRTSPNALGGGYSPPPLAPVKSGSGALVMTLLGISLAGVAGYFFYHKSQAPSPPVATPTSVSISPELTPPLSTPPPTEASQLVPPQATALDEEDLPPAPTSLEEPAESTETTTQPEPLSFWALVQASSDKELRTWHLSNGETVQATLQGLFDNSACLLSTDQQKISLPISEMNSEDKAYYQAWFKKERDSLPEGLIDLTLRNGTELRIRPIGFWKPQILCLDERGNPGAVAYRDLDASSRRNLARPYRRKMHLSKSKQHNSE